MLICMLILRTKIPACWECNEGGGCHWPSGKQLPCNQWCRLRVKCPGVFSGRLRSRSYDPIASSEFLPISDEASEQNISWWWQINNYALPASWMQQKPVVNWSARHDLPPASRSVNTINHPRAPAVHVKYVHARETLAGCLYWCTAAQYQTETFSIGESQSPAPALPYRDGLLESYDEAMVSLTIP